VRKFIRDRLSIVIPTFNEENNITLLVDDIIELMVNKDYEIFIVDDGSTDSTVKNIFKNHSNNKNIKVIQRECDRGLLQSIKFALQSITGEYFVVMDGDRQHSPNDINSLVENLQEYDLSIGVRDLKNLTQVSSIRAFLSKLFNKIIKIVLSVKISDPLTGFFAGKASLLNSKFFLLSNSGFKVLLDLIFSNKKEKIKVCEKKISFGVREDGQSKLGSQVIFSFVTQLLSYTFNGLISSKFIGFCIIGGFGFFIHFSILLFLLNAITLPFFISHMIATIFGATFNFFINNYLNFYNSRINSIKKTLQSLLKYYLINLPGLLTSVGAASFVYNMLNTNPLLASLIGVLIDTVFKYIVSRTWIWKTN